MLRPYVIGPLRGEPIVNFPAGTTTISGQSLAHSLKASLGLSACSVSAVSTWGRT